MYLVMNFQGFIKLTFLYSHRIVLSISTKYDMIPYQGKRIKITELSKIKGNLFLYQMGIHNFIKDHIKTF